MKRTIVKATLALFLSGTGVALAGWEEGVAAFQAGKYQDAAREFEGVAAQQPEWPGGHLMLGRALLKLDKASQAVAALKKAYDLDPNSAQTKMVLGQAYLEAKRYQEASNVLKTIDASKLDAAQKSTLHQLSAAAMNGSGQSDGAIEALKRAAASNPNDASLQYQLGALALSNQDAGTAIAALEKAARLKSGDVDILKAYTKALLLSGRTTQGSSKVAAYKKAAEVAAQVVAKANTYDNVLTLGEAQLGAKAYGDAISTFERAKGLKPGDWLVPYYIGQAQTSLEQYTKAESTLGAALQGASGDATKKITQQLAFVYEKQKKFDEAIAAYRRVGDEAGAQRAERNKVTALENDAIEKERILLEQLQRERDALEQQMKGGGGGGG